jgi:hypothetical protein
VHRPVADYHAVDEPEAERIMGVPDAGLRRPESCTCHALGFVAASFDQM